MSTTAYRVYKARDGSSECFCGEYPSYEEAKAAAEQEPGGLDKSLWGTAKAAGHVCGMQAPGDGEESEPLSWHGPSGWHCVVRVDYDDAEATKGVAMSTTETVIFQGREIDLAAARELMDDELCEQIHGTVDTEQDFFDAYLAAHEAKFGAPFVFA